MARGSRFRRLPPPRPELPAELRTVVAVRSRGAAGDLFEHFGVPSERPGEREQDLATPIMLAEPCSGCGWLARADQAAHACRLCGSLVASSLHSK